MAKTVYTPEEIELFDGTVVTARKIPVAFLKKAMSYIDDYEWDEDNPYDGLDYIVGLTRLCLPNQLQDDYSLDENLDPDTARRIILVATGIDVQANEENLVEAAVTAVAKEQSGQN